jgi:hypothetical protein
MQRFDTTSLNKKDQFFDDLATDHNLIRRIKVDLARDATSREMKLTHRNHRIAPKNYYNILTQRKLIEPLLKTLTDLQIFTSQKQIFTSNLRELGA